MMWIFKLWVIVGGFENFELWSENIESLISSNFFEYLFFKIVIWFID